MARKKESAVYMIKHNSSGKMYVGSSGRIEYRIYEHKWLLSRNEHFNKELQKSYNIDSNISIFTRRVATRDDVFDAEQRLLDKYFNKGKLFNKSPNARTSGTGRKYTPSEFQRKRASETHSNKVTTEKTKQIFKEKLGKKVIVDGIEYLSIREVAKAFNLSRPATKHRFKSNSEQFKNWKFKDDV